MHWDVDALRRLLASRSTDALSAAVDRLVAAAGVRHWVYAVDLPMLGAKPGRVVLGGYPASWVTHYFAQGYQRIDPVVAHCHERSAPCLWADARVMPAEASNTYAVARLFDEAGEFGLRDGISVPLHGPGLSWGLMSFTSDEPEDVDFTRLAPSLHLLAQFVHDAGRQLTSSAPASEGAALTPRELEALRWAAIGKTSWEDVLRDEVALEPRLERDEHGGNVAIAAALDVAPDLLEQVHQVGVVLLERVDQTRVVARHPRDAVREIDTRLRLRSFLGRLSDDPAQEIEHARHPQSPWITGRRSGTRGRAG